MSSEMREVEVLLNKWLVRYNELIQMDRTNEAEQVLRCINDGKRALLARTEAGADGDDLAKRLEHAADYEGESGGWDETIALLREAANRVRTRPQDASGDAVTGRVNGYMFSARAIEIITDGEVPEWITKAPGLRVTITAMQAKEAK